MSRPAPQRRLWQQAEECMEDGCTSPILARSLCSKHYQRATAAGFPAADAEEGIREIGRLMETEINGVPIASDSGVYGPSWGHGYGAPS